MLKHLIIDSKNLSYDYLINKMNNINMAKTDKPLLYKRSVHFQR